MINAVTSAPPPGVAGGPAATHGRQASAKTPLVTGNGYGFAVYDPAKGGITQFFIPPTAS